MHCCRQRDSIPFENIIGMNSHFEYLQVWTQVALFLADSIGNAVPGVKLSKKINHPVSGINMSLKIQKSRKIRFSAAIQKARREGEIECEILIGKSNAHIQSTVGLVAKVLTREVERRKLAGQVSPMHKHIGILRYIAAVPFALGRENSCQKKGKK